MILFADILACSGAGAPATIANNVMFARCTIAGSVTLVLLSAVAYLFVRRFPSLLVCQAVLAGTHPSFWDSGMHGDCGTTVTATSMTWLIVGAMFLLAQYAGRFLPVKPLHASRGFPVITDETIKHVS